MLISVRIVFFCFFWSVLISLLINSLDIRFVSDLFFSTLAKYLVFRSLFSIMFALDLNIKPFSSHPIMDSNSFFVCCSSFLICFNLPSSFISPISFVTVSILDLRFVLIHLFPFLFFFVANLIVSFLTVPFINSQRVFGLASVLNATYSFIFFLICSWFSPSSKRLLFNLKYPGPLVCCVTSSFNKTKL